MKKLTTEKYIDKCQSIHNNYYDYSKTVYEKDKTYVTIICPEHGEFSQRCDHHARGSKCPHCATNIRTSKLRLTLKEFIDRANSLHCNRYTYDKAIYITSRTKLIVTCRSHGDFSVTPDNHLSGTICFRCAVSENAKRATHSKSDVIDKASFIHDNIYNYDKVIYLHSKEKVIITCNLHGDFLQNFSNHLSGKGCPSCHITSKSEVFIARLLKHNNIEFISQKSFDNLRNPKTNRKLKFDFYIPSINTVIEFDGKHHFVEIEKYNNDLEYQKFKDNIKDIYCKDNNIILIRIPYFKNIVNILKHYHIIEKSISE